MNFIDNINLSFSSILRNKLRAFLTGLIIAIGIMALVGILTSIDGLKLLIGKQFSFLGANTVSVSNYVMKIELDKEGEERKNYPPISYEEIKVFKNQFPYDFEVSAYIWCAATSILTYGGEETTPNITVYASDESFLVTEGHEIAFGRNFSEVEVSQGKPIILLGYSAAKSLFPHVEEAVGKFIKLDKKRYQVAGVLKEKGATLLTNDRFVVIPPLQSQSKYLYDDMSYDLHVFIPSGYDRDEVITEVIGTMRQARNLGVTEENNFEINSSIRMVEDFDSMTENITYGGFGISIITLLGAAIALMNIMLVSVTERTKEIGIMKSLGASPINILFQFLFEAILICIFGGILGIFLGITIGNVFTLWVGGEFNIPWVWIILGLVFCISVGLISGLYPAIKASEQDPIESLRYE